MRTPTPATGAKAAGTAEVRLRELDRKTAGAVHDFTAQITATPRGVLGRAIRTSAPAQFAAGEMTVLSLAAVAVSPGRLVRVSAPSLLVFTTATTGAPVIQAHLRYTLDGSVPTTASAVLQQGNVTPDLAAHGTLMTLERILPIGATAVQLGVLLTVFSPTGPNGGILANAAYPISLLVEDLGNDPGDRGTSYN